MSKAHRDHDVRCQICEETYCCDEGFSCPSKMCDSCGEKMNALQPAAQDLFEILLKRVVRLEDRKS
jgi:hypothetical protein